jgi:hypothetical protein
MKSQACHPMEIRNNRLPLFLLSAISLAVYAFSIHHEFIPYLDDSAYVLGNYAIQGLTADNLKSAFTRYFVGNYAPIQIVSYMLDYTLWGMNPMGYILTNIILHTLNGLSFYMLLARSGWGRLAAWCPSIIFLLHPVQVESVVWISQRKTVLAMFFFLASFHCYLSWRREKLMPSGKINYFLSLGLFALSILSKSVAVILPVALLIHDIGSRDEKTLRVNIKDKIPYLIIALVGALLAFRSQSGEMGGGRVEYYGGSPLTTFITMLPVLSKYLAIVFFPADLGIEYPVSIKDSVDSEVVFAGIVAVALILLGIFLFRRFRDLFCWYALFFLGLLPVSQIVPIATLMNDRYLYFPLLGAAPFTCASITKVVQHWPRWRSRAAIVCFAALLFLPILTLDRENVWKNSLTVWSDVVRMVPDNRQAWQILLDEYGRRDDHEGALAASLQLLSRIPDDLTGLSVAGQLYTKKGDLLSGRRYLERAAMIYPNNTEIYFLLAENYLQAGDVEKTAEVLKYVLSLDPSSERAIQELRKIGNSAKVSR